MNLAKKPITYAQAGVDIEAGDAFVEHIKPLARSTTRSEVMAGIGGFGALCAIPTKYKQPILVSGTDGIGTKLKMGLDIDHLETLGIDLVAMCANDVLTLGAEPLFFLDYYACGRLSLNDGVRLMQGVAEGCRQAGCALIGGETAEMPGLYEGRDFDMAGFVVGVVEKDGIIDGSKIKEGDSLIGLASSGPHSNGYSLIRRILKQTDDWQNQTLMKTYGDEQKPIAEILIEPTKIYTKILQTLTEQVKVLGLAHITGGGLVGNVPRMIPKHLQAVIKKGSWPMPPIFSWLQKEGEVATAEMQRVFNLGIGMVAVVSPADTQRALNVLHAHHEKSWVIGHVEKLTSTAQNPTDEERCVMI